MARSSYFDCKTDKIHFKRDATWIEYGATLSQSHLMFELPVAVSTRKADDIPARKRAMYKRRYEMLRILNADIGRSVQENCPKI